MANRWSIYLHQKSAFLRNVVCDLDLWTHDLENFISHETVENIHVSFATNHFTGSDAIKFTGFLWLSLPDAMTKCSGGTLHRWSGTSIRDRTCNLYKNVFCARRKVIGDGTVQTDAGRVVHPCEVAARIMQINASKAWTLELTKTTASIINWSKSKLKHTLFHLAYKTYDAALLSQSFWVICYIQCL